MQESLHYRIEFLEQKVDESRLEDVVSKVVKMADKDGNGKISFGEYRRITAKQSMERLLFQELGITWVQNSNLFINGIGGTSAFRHRVTINRTNHYIHNCMIVKFLLHHNLFQRTISCHF